MTDESTYRRNLIERAKAGDEWVSGHDLCVRIGYLVLEDEKPEVAGLRAIVETDKRSRADVLDDYQT
jgi:hypothetical protein